MNTPDQLDRPTATFELNTAEPARDVPLWVDALGVVAWAAAIVAVCVTPAVVIAAWRALL